MLSLDNKNYLKSDIMVIFQADPKLKVVVILGFIVISLSCWVAFFSPARGFELSIYESTPISFWIGSIFCILCGVFIIVHQVYTKQCKHSSFWIFGFMLLIMCRVILLYMPFIRGYYTWRGDNLSQIGYLIDILSTGHVDANNFYPITHILLLNIHVISNISLQIVVNYSTALLSAFYVISIYLVSTFLFHKKATRLLSVAAIGCVLFDGYNVYLMPNGWSIFYIPFIMFLFFKSYQQENSSEEYKLLFVITLILCPFFHPLSSLIVFLILVSMGIGNHLFVGKYNNKQHSLNLKFSISNAVLIEFIIFNMWILSFKRFSRNIQDLYYSIIRGQSPNVIENMGNTLDKIGIHGFDFIELIIKMMGDEIIFLTFTVIAGIILLKCHKNGIKNVSNINLSILLWPTFVIIFLYISYLLNIIPGLESVGSARLVSYSVLFTPCFMAFVFEYFTTSHEKVLPIFFIFIIIGASLISIFSLFTSPYVINPNSQATEMNIHGTMWLTNYKSPNEDCDYITSNIRRFADAVIGCENSTNTFKSYIPIPDHFNYTTYPYLGCSYSENKYAFISKLDEIVYVSVWKSVGRFDTEDFVRLEFDPTVDKLYHNGETYFYFIHSM